MSRGRARGFDGGALRSHREARRLGRADLADLIGVSTSTVAKWEVGTQAPDPRSVAKVRALFQLDPHALILLEEHELELSDVRIMAGFTVQCAAERTGATRAKLAEIEAGRRFLDTALARALGDLYDVQPARLLELWSRTRERRRARLRMGLQAAAPSAVDGR